MLKPTNFGGEDYCGSTETLRPVVPVEPLCWDYSAVAKECSFQSSLITVLLITTLSVGVFSLSTGHKGILLYALISFQQHLKVFQKKNCDR